MDRGEVRWFTFASPNKRRPIVVLTQQNAIKYLNDITVAQITSTVRDVPSQVRLDQTDGLDRVCAVNLFQIDTIPKRLIGSRIVRLSQTRMSEVDQALKFALELD